MIRYSAKKPAGVWFPTAGNCRYRYQISPAPAVTTPLDLTSTASDHITECEGAVVMVGVLRRRCLHTVSINARPLDRAIIDLLQITPVGDSGGARSRRSLQRAIQNTGYHRRESKPFGNFHFVCPFRLLTPFGLSVGGRALDNSHKYITAYYEIKTIYIDSVDI